MGSSNMIWTWRDYATGVVHVIEAHSSPFDSTHKQSKRMRCGREVITERGLIAGRNDKTVAVLLPWVHGHDTPTCILCMVDRVVREEQN
jgi:hypothetical protein